MVLDRPHSPTVSCGAFYHQVAWLSKAWAFNSCDHSGVARGGGGAWPTIPGKWMMGNGGPITGCLVRIVTKYRRQFL